MAAIIVIAYVDKILGKKLKQFDYIFTLLLSIIGARILFLIHNLERVEESLFYIFKVWDGGLALYGGLIGLSIGILIVSKIRKISLFQISDSVGYILPIAQAFGRIGNFINNELYGYPTSLPWAVKIPFEDRIKGYEAYSTFHPTFLYESLLSLISFFLIWLASKRLKLKSGDLSTIYLLNYGAIRLFVNQFRIQKDYYWIVESSDLFSLIFIGLALIIFLYNHSSDLSPVRKKILLNLRGL